MSQQSHVSFVADGSTSVYTVPFSLTENSKVFVVVDGYRMPYQWLAQGTLRLAKAPPEGSEVSIRKRTTLDYLAHKWKHKMPVTAAMESQDYERILSALHEIRLEINKEKQSNG